MSETKSHKYQIYTLHSSGNVILIITVPTLTQFFLTTTTQEQKQVSWKNPEPTLEEGPYQNVFSY